MKLAFSDCFQGNNSLFPFGNETIVNCKESADQNEFCNCLEPHKGKFSNGEEKFAIKLGESFSKMFEKNLSSILKDISLIQYGFENLNNLQGNSEMFSNKSCNMYELQDSLRACGDKSVYTTLENSNSKYALSNIINKYKNEVSLSKASYIAVDNKKCSDNYRCEFKSSCELSDLKAQSIQNDFKAQEIQSFLAEIRDSLVNTNSLDAAISLELVKARKNKNLKRFKMLKTLGPKLKGDSMLKSLFDISKSDLISFADKNVLIKNFFTKEDHLSKSLSDINDKCKKSFKVFKDFMCQGVNELNYDFSSREPADIISEFNSSLYDFSGSFQTCKSNNERDTEELNLLGNILTADERLIESGEVMNRDNLKNTSHKVRSLLCENIPASNKKLKKQLKELSKKIETACSSNSSKLFEYKNKVIEDEATKLEACSYLLSYKKSLEKKEQTQKYVKKNKSFKKFLKENPNTLIKSEKEYLQKIEAPSVAKSLLFGDEENESQKRDVPEVQETVAKENESKGNLNEAATDKNTNTVLYKPSYSFKSNPKEKKAKSSASNVNYIAPPTGLSFTYKDDAKDALRYRLDKLKEKMAKEESKQKELLDLYNNGTDSDRERIDSLFDDYEPVNVGVSNVSDDEVQRIIDEEKLIDSGLKSPRRSRSIASTLSDYVASNKDVMRETINKDILSNDRIEVVSQTVGSSEKIDAFNIELGPNGYELQKLIVAGSIEKDLSLVYDSDPKKSIVDKIARSSANQSEQVKKYKKLLQSKKDFLISRHSDLEVEVIVRYNHDLKRHVVDPFIGSVDDAFYLVNKEKYDDLRDQVEQSIKEGDFETLSRI